MVEWVRVSRSGTPRVQPAGEGVVSVTFKTAPPYSTDWVGYFDQRAADLGVHVTWTSSGYDGNDARINAGEDYFEESIALVDQAIEFANDQYEAIVIPRLNADAEERQRKLDNEKARQAALDARAAKLARPEVDPFGVGKR